MSRLIFLYGTMQPALARGASARLAAALGEGLPASISGRLHAVILPQGAYPVLWPTGESRVAGQVFNLPDLPGWLASVDAYEAYDPDDEAGSEYLRRDVTATLTDGEEVTAQAYVARHPPGPDLPVIGHGEFARFLRETGLPPFAG